MISIAVDPKAVCLTALKDQAIPIVATVKMLALSATVAENGEPMLLRTPTLPTLPLLARMGLQQQWRTIRLPEGCWDDLNEHLSQHQSPGDTCALDRWPRGVRTI